MNTKKLSTLTKSFISGRSNPAPEIQSRIRDSIADEIAAAYAGSGYGKAVMVKAIRGGADIDILKVNTLSAALYIANTADDSGYLLKGSKLDIRTGKGKTLANDLSMAATAAAICLPELNEALYAWHARATKPVVVAPAEPVPNSGQSEPEKPLPIPTPLAKTPEQVKAAEVKAEAEVLAFNSETPEVHHDAPLPKESGTAKAVDNVAQLVDLIDDTLGDDELTALIFELQKLRVDRTMKKAA